MRRRIEFERSAEREPETLGDDAAKRILRYMRERIARYYDPRSAGDALKGDRLGRFWKYRVGDYRLVAHIDRSTVRILVVRAGHWREMHR